VIGTAPAVDSDTEPRPPRSRALLSGGLNGTGARWLLVPPAVFLALALGAPIVYLTILGFQNGGFDAALDDTVFRGSVPRTFLLAAVVTAFAVVLGTISAIGLAVAPKWVAAVMLICLFTLFWTSLLVRTYGWLLLYLPQGAMYEVLHSVGLRDEPLDIFQKPLASYPAMVHVMLPYVVLPVYASLRQVEPDQIRAARVLGARPLRILGRVLLPQMRAGIIAAAVLVFIISLGFFVTPSLLGDPTSPTVAGLIGSTFNQPEADNVASAMSLLLLAVVVVIYALADKILGISKQWEEERA
jgi:putative spermidine/putrescine transport system permease protein